MRLAIILTALLGIWWFATVVPAEARPPRKGQIGWASWYGSFHHGKSTANGERFSMHRLTAAHRPLPLGTTVVVTHLRTRRQGAVRINDRGPYVDHKRRIIDLSRAAARRLGFEHPGLAPMRIMGQQKAPARSTREAQAPLLRGGRRASFVPVFPWCHDWSPPESLCLGPGSVPRPSYGTTLDVSGVLLWIFAVGA